MTMKWTLVTNWKDLNSNSAENSKKVVYPLLILIIYIYVKENQLKDSKDPFLNFIKKFVHPNKKFSSDYWGNG